MLAVKGSYGAIGVRGSGSTAGGVSDRGGAVYPRTAHIQGFETEGAVPVSVERDFEDIIQLGLGMTDRKLARIQAEDAYETMLPLTKDWGAEIFPRQWGMMSHGAPIALALARQVRKSDVAVMTNTMVVDLLVENGSVAGAVTVNEQSDQAHVIKAGAVFFGTGGEGAMFKHHTTSTCTTGDGYAMAYRAGAALMNLEFKQIFPGVIYPTINHFSAWWFVPYVRIYNALGEEYLPKYLPPGITLDEVYKQRGSHGPFSARDSASRYFDVATIIETKEGRSNEHDALCVDLTDPRVKDPLVPARHEYFYYRGIRYLEQPIEFNICFQCSNGGIRIDENGESTLPGLYAAGEAAAGPHGANRLAGHMLTTSQIFGRRAGRHAAARTAGKTKPEAGARTIERALEPIRILSERTGSERPAAVRKDLRRIAWDNLLAHINANTLASARREFADVAGTRMERMDGRSRSDMVNALEVRNMLAVGQILTEVIDMRKESRGDQYREDYPSRDDANWNRVIVVSCRDGRMNLDTEIIDPKWSERRGDMQGIRWG